MGSAAAFSVREVIAAAEQVTGLAVPTILGERRNGDPAQLVSDARKAREKLLWEPQIRDLSEILRTA